MIRTAAQLWRAQADKDACPGVQQLISAKFLDPGPPERDPWGSEFEIRCTEAEVIVRSRGADMKMGTSDDITIPALE